MKRLLAVAAATLVVGCSMDKQTAPSLTGPSELGLSIGVTATPDVITQDGQSQATIAITARDASNQPMSGVTLRAEIYVGGTPVDFGTLSSKVASTGSDGQASLTYRAPAAPPPTANSDALVQILVTPVGSNYGGSYARNVQIRLARPGVIVPPGDGPVASFFISPTNPREDDDIFFDGSASTGNIVSYSWNFGDGRSDSSSSPTTRHRYGLAGTYSVTLTVRDNVGREVTSAPTTVTVTALNAATQLAAKLVISPSSVKPGELITFDASTSTATPGHTVVQYLFNFGDGSPIVVGDSPYAHYAYPGGTSGSSKTYKVVLIVTDDTGRTASSSDGTVIVTTP